MSTTEEKANQQQEQEDKAQREARRQEKCARLEAVIAAGVLRGLGRPADFLRAGARRLWGNYYRVNVFAGPDAASARIAHSFFLETDGEGNVLTSDPPVTRAY